MPDLPSQFVTGFLTPFRGLSFMRLRPTLWAYGVWPTLLNLLVTLLTLAFFLTSVGALGWWWEPSTWWPWLDWLVKGLAVLLAIVVAGVLSIGLWLVLQGLLVSYFYSLLAEKVERELGIAEGEIQSVPLSKQAIDTARSVGLLLSVLVITLLMAFVPIVGVVLGTVASLYGNWLLLGIEFWSYPLDLRGLRWKQKVAWCRQHRGYTLGVGAVVLTVAWIPILGAFFLTTAVTGVVLLHRRIAAMEAAEATT